MNKDSVKNLVEEEMGSKVSARQEKLIEGLIETYVGINNLGLDALAMIYRSGIKVSLNNEYQPFLAKTRQEELKDQFLLSVFCLVVSRPINNKHLKI